MAITVPQILGTQSTHATSLQSAAFGSTPTTGNTIIVVIIWFGSGTSITSVVDNVAGSPNTYTQDGTTVISGNNHVAVYRCANITGGASFKLTVTFNGSSFLSFCAIEAAGLANTSTLDGAGSTNTGVNNAAQPSTGTFSTSNANDLLLGAFATDSKSNTATVPTGFTVIADDHGANENGNAAYQILSSTQTNINPTWANVNSNGSTWVAIGLAYKAAAGGTVTSPWWYYDSPAIGGGCSGF